MDNHALFLISEILEAMAVLPEQSIADKAIRHWLEGLQRLQLGLLVQVGLVNEPLGLLEPVLRDGRPENLVKWSRIFLLLLGLLRFSS